MMLSNEEQLELWKQWKSSKDDKYMVQLMQSLQPLLKGYIRQFTSGPIPYSALLGQANILARDALKSYDPEKAQINTYITHQLQPMHRFVGKYQNLKYTPEYISQQYGRYEHALRTLENQLNRHPTHEEIAEFMEVKPKTVARIEQGMAPETFVGSLPEELGDEEMFNAIVESKQKDDMAYLRAELTGNERKAFDLLSGWNRAKPITDTKEVADKLNLDVNDIYEMRRRWNRRLKSVREW